MISQFTGPEASNPQEYLSDFINSEITSGVFVGSLIYLLFISSNLQ